MSRCKTSKRKGEEGSSKKKKEKKGGTLGDVLDRSPPAACLGQGGSQDSQMSARAFSRARERKGLGGVKRHGSSSIQA